MGSLITKAGLADIATASFLQQQCNWTQIAVGDGGGSDYVPTDSQSELKGQKWKGSIDNYTATNETQGVFQAHIPADIGGFMIREIGILNEDDELVAIGTIEATPKTAITGESDHYNDMLINFHIAVDHADVIKVQINPNITVATTEYVQELVETTCVQKEEGKSLVSDEDITQITTNKENIASNTSSISDLQTNKVDKEQGKSLVSDEDIAQITTNKTNIASLTTEVGKKVEAVAGKSLVLDTDIEQITTNKNNIATIQEQLSGVETTLSGLNTRMGDVV